MIPRFKSLKTTPSDKGITDQPTRLKIKAKEGANKNIPVFAFVGKVVSLTNNFKPSARGCKRPMKPINIIGIQHLYLLPMR